jgi:hypothetical protein
VLEAVEVAAGHHGNVLGGDPAEEVCLVEELNPVEEGCEAAPFAPEATRRVARDRIRLRTVRMGGNEGGARLPGGTKGLEDPSLKWNERSQADGDGVRGLVRVEVVVGELQPGDDQHPVADERPLRLLIDRGEVGLEVPSVDEGTTVPGSLLPIPGVVASERVVGHAEHVEARATVLIDELPQGERSIAPGRMGMKLAEERPPTGGYFWLLLTRGSVVWRSNKSGSEPFVSARFCLSLLRCARNEAGRCYPPGGTHGCAKREALTGRSPHLYRRDLFAVRSRRAPSGFLLRCRVLSKQPQPVVSERAPHFLRSRCIVQWSSLDGTRTKPQRS